MAVSITIKKDLKITEKGTVSLVYQATGFDVTSKIFAIEVFPSSSDCQAPQYRFSHVCSPAELVEFPEQILTDNCYFRTDCIEMVFDTYKLAEKVDQTLQEDVRKLIEELKKLEDTPSTSDILVFE